MSFMLERVYSAFGITGKPEDAILFGSGLINHTWKVHNRDQNFVLQRINDQVFRTPDAIASNISKVGKFLAEKQPDYLFVRPEPTLDGAEHYVDPEHGYFRLTPFVEGSHTIDVVSNTGQAFEAARQFGLFTSHLRDFPVDQLQITLPDFHNLPLRYTQFEQALLNGNAERIRQSAKLIGKARASASVTEEFLRLRSGAALRVRPTHHDTKISNVLFSGDDKGLCVIDLDTLMPGYFISDLGDMMRTYLSPASEEVTDLHLLGIRDDYFTAIMEGYLGQLRDQLSPEERDGLVYAGKFMIYMQALRFLTDHLNNDVYYGARYPDHNLNRAANQFELLDRLMEKETALKALVSRFNAPVHAVHPAYK